MSSPGGTPPEPRRCTIVECLAVFVVCLVVYLTNFRSLASGDSAPASLLPWQLLHRHRLDFEDFRESYLHRSDLGYGFVNAGDGRLVSAYPVGTSIVALPLYAAFYGWMNLTHGPMELTSPAFESTRLACEKLAAAILTAAAVAIFYAGSRLKFPRPTAVVTTVVLAFGTGTWTTASQALWQHTGVVFLLAVAIACLLRANRGASRGHAAVLLTIAGFCTGLLPGARPTAAALALPLAAYMLVTHGRLAICFAFPAAAVGAAPWLLWNYHFFHNFIGGYAAGPNFYRLRLADVGVRLAGVLVSPSRGLLVFTPVLLLSLAAIPALLRSRERDERLILWLAGGCLILVLNYGLYKGWWGGSSYGPRYLTDVFPVACFLLNYAIDLPWRRRGVFNLAFLALAGFGILAQVAGAYSANNEWNDIPLPVDDIGGRLWDVRDSQIERHARWVWRRAVGPHLREDYLGRLSGCIVDVSQTLTLDRITRPARLDHALLAAGTRRTVRVTVVNTGTDRWYGYQSVLDRGRMCVVVTVSTPEGRTASRDRLYLSGNVDPGGRGEVIGYVRVPRQGGGYVATFEMATLGLGPFPPRAETPAPRLAFESDPSGKGEARR